jgi:ubiquinone/menaquinone biosynthesis C-methylase UbiE
VIRSYFNQKAAIWDEVIAEKDAIKLEAMAHRLDIKTGASVLDVGTGTGVFVPFLLNKIGGNGRLVAIDIAEEMLRMARAKDFSSTIDHIHADIVTLPIAKDSFDVAVCYSSFPHFHDKPKALSEIARVLKGGGSLFICHTSSRATINMIHSELPAVKNDLIPHAADMLQLLADAGFSNARIEDNTDNYLTSAIKL